jgi:hypothetical protein
MQLVGVGDGTADSIASLAKASLLIWVSESVLLPDASPLSPCFSHFLQFVRYIARQP